MSKQAVGRWISALLDCISLTVAFFHTAVVHSPSTVEIATRRLVIRYNGNVTTAEIR